MKKYIALCAAILSLLMIVSCSREQPQNGPYPAPTSSEADWTYAEKENGELAITSYTGTVEHVEIPSSIGGKTVSEIGYGAFSDNTTIISLTIPASVTAISDGSLSGSSKLEYVSVSAENPSFSSEKGIVYNKDKTKLIVYPNAFTASAFDVPDTVKEIGYKAFAWAQKLELVNIPHSVDQITKWAFYGCDNLKTVTFAEGVEIIGEKAFANCGALETISLPNSVKTIDTGAFSGSKSLKRIMTNGNHYHQSIDGVLFNADGTVLITYPLGRPETEYTVPSGTVEIGESAFENCQTLKKVNLPNSLQVIGKQAFNLCQSLEEITLPDHVTTVGYRAFAQCKSLREIVLPNTVTSLGTYAFELCSSLKSATLPDSLAVIPKATFSGCSALLAVSGGANVTEIADQAFSGCKNMLGYQLPTNVEKIGGYAFYNCSGFGVVELPASLTEAALTAFWDCADIELVAEPGTYGEQFIQELEEYIEYLESEEA